MRITRMRNAAERRKIARGKQHTLRMLLDDNMPSLTQHATAEGLENRLLFAAATPTVLTAFDGITDGAPQVGVTISGDTLYGTTPIGGDNDDGTVYSMPLTGGTPDLIAGFDGTDGHQPMGDLLLIDNTLYGTTSAGGANNKGVVFSVPISGGDPNVLATFNGSNGNDPEAALIVSGNLLYGTTFSGGANNMGEVFSVPLTGGTINVLASFNGTDGENPQGTLVLQNEILYGNTRTGGMNNGGTIYSLPIAGGTPNVLANMDTTSGETPQGPLVLRNNTLYGAASAAGANSKGTVFSLPISGGTPTVLFNFDGTHGSTPTAGLISDSGILYASTAEGGANNLGAVIGMFPAVSTPTLLASLNASTGSLPLGAVAISNGILYGTTQQGGSSNVGTVFSVNPASTDSLSYDLQPSNGLADSPLEEVVIFVNTANGSLDGLSSGTVQLSIASGPPGAVLSGTTTVPITGASAAFNGLSVNIGGDYTLIARDITDASATSSSFTVERNDSLALTVVPTTAVADSPMGNVVVQVNRNSTGTVDTSYNGTVNVVLSSIDQVVGGALTGTTTVNAVNGVATFSDLSINAEGTFFLVAHDDTGADAFGVTDPITVTHNPTELTVAVDLTKSTIAGAFLPGEKATATITFNNTATALAKGVMNVQLLLDSLGNSAPLNVAALNHISLNLAPGKSKKFNASFVVPSLVDGIGQILRATLTPISGFTQPSLPTGPVIENGINDAFVEVGNVENHPNTKITESIGGVPVHLSMTGPGKASITVNSTDNTIITLDITGTTAASSITAIASSPFTLDGITADSVLGSIKAPLLNINGNIALPGGAKTLLLGNINGSAFTLGGFSPATVAIGNLVNTSLVTTAPLHSLAINSFTNTGTATSIQTAAITSFTDKGDYAGNLATTGNLTKATISGTLTGDILAGTNLGTDNLPGGHDDEFDSGTITSLHIFGGVSSSIIAAGLRVNEDDFTLNTFFGLDNSKISAIRIDGALSSDSKILSLLLPPKATVAGQSLATAGDSRFVTLQLVEF